MLKQISRAVYFPFIPLHTFNFSSSKIHFSNQFFRFSNKLLPTYAKAYYVGIMRKVVILTLVTLFTCVEYSQAQTTEKEMTRQEKKAAQEALDKMLFQEAKEAIDNQTFVLEADRVYFKYGTSAFVSSNTNFVGLDGDKAVVQVAFNVPFSGPNGLGGITVDGNASNYKVKTDKKGNIHVSMNVMGIGISAQVSIDIPYGSNNATVDILPNFNSSHMTLSGQILPLKKANVFKGRSL